MRSSFLLFILFFISFNLYAQSSWQPKNEGLNGKISLASMAINPQYPNEIFAGSDTGGLYKSDSDGRSWHEINKDLFEGSNVCTILISPKDTHIVYVSTYEKGIFKSVDGGTTWTTINQGLPTTHISTKQLVMHPQNPNEIYTVSLHGGIFKTSDAGNHWQKITPDLPVSMYIQLDISATNPNVLILTAYDKSIETVLYKSIDGGKTWQQLPQQQGFYVFTVRFSPDNPQVMYGIGNSFYQTKDGGSTWTVLRKTPDQNYVHEFLIDKRNSKIIYIYVQHEGLYKTIDDGQTWTLINNSLNNSDEWMMLQQHPSLPDRFYFSSEEYGMAQSNDAGEHWQITNAGIFNATITALANDSQNPNVAYAGNQLGLWIMRDGKNWMQDKQLIGKAIKSIVVDSNQPSHIIVITEESGNKSIYVSNNQGASWTLAKVSGKFFDLAAHMITFNPKNGQEVYASEFFGKLWKSNDGGLTWSNLGELPEGAVVYTMAINPNQPQEIFVGAMRQGNNLLFKSMDGGHTWQNLTTKLAPKESENRNDTVYSLVYDPIQINTVYALAAVKDALHLFKSTDGGNSWQVVDKEGLEQLWTLAYLVFDSKNPKTLYASTGFCATWCESTGEGIFASYDSGAHWQAINTGLNNAHTLGVVVNKTSLRTGTDGSGVFELAI